MKKCLVFLTLCILLNGCGKTEKAVHAPVGKTPYSIFVEAEHTPALMEKDKCMSGACIYEDMPYNDIDSFEDKIQAKNDIYIYYIKKGEDFPMNFVVSCYAKGKTPMLVLGTDSSYEEVMSIALTCGSLELPMLIEMDYGNELDMYNAHSSLFRGYAPKTALVYGFSSDRKDYRLPDEESYDWIAVNAYEKMSGGSIDSEYEDIARWCDIYKNKAVMVNIAVPVFTDDRCNYAIAEACDEIGKIYSLTGQYKNIGALNYISISENDEGRRKYSSRLSESDEIMTAYGNAVNNIPEMRYYSASPYIGYVIGDKVYVTGDTALLLGLKGDNTPYSNLKALVNYSVDNEERRIFLSN